jgi:hypothetical protein
MERQNNRLITKYTETTFSVFAVTEAAHGGEDKGSRAGGGRCSVVERRLGSLYFNCEWGLLIRGLLAHNI